MDTKPIAGEYYLQGVMETASGFLLEPNGHFRFFFSYGALDRNGSGKWEVKGDQVVLNSPKPVGQDFTLVASKKTNTDLVHVKIENEDVMIRRHVYCSMSPLAPHDRDSWKSLSQHGEVSFPIKSATSISLLFEFSPERISTVAVNPDHNDFTFRLESTIMQVYFNDFILMFTDEGLNGPHPLMQNKKFNYFKQ